jgi:hypothetical protein
VLQPGVYLIDSRRLLHRHSVLLSLRTKPTRQGAEDEKAFVPCSPHRIPSGVENTSDTCDIAISAKQRNFVSPIKNSRLM